MNWVKEWVCVFLNLVLLAIVENKLSELKQMMMMMIMMAMMTGHFQEANEKLDNQANKKSGSQDCSWVFKKKH